MLGRLVGLIWVGTIMGLNILDRENVCDKRCSFLIKPVCGTDGVTYPNECKLLESACLAELSGRTPPAVSSSGKCPGGPGPQIEAVVAEVEEEEHGCPEDCSSKQYKPVCGTDGVTYSNRCTLKMSSCNSSDSGDGRIYVSREEPCGVVDVKSLNELAIDKCDICTRDFRPVCGTDGTTHSNECQMEATGCRKGQIISLTRSGPCQDGDVVFRGNNQNLRCDALCTTGYRPVCATDGQTNMTFTNLCQMTKASCSTNQTIRFLSQGVCPRPLNNLYSRSSLSEVDTMAFWGVRQLTKKLGSETHLKLAYVESAKVEVMSGNNFMMTVLVGSSNCPSDEDYGDHCKIVNPDTNLRCDIVVHQSSTNSEDLKLTKNVCDAAFDFRNVCIGCPLDGSPEAEAANTVAQYVVRQLTETAAAGHALQRHLGLDYIKKFIRESDGNGGFRYTIDVEVSETECKIYESFNPDRCPGTRNKPRLCSAEVIEHNPGEKFKLKRLLEEENVEIRRFEVSYTICKDAHDTVDLGRQAEVEDPDVIDVAKAVTNKVASPFPGSAVWLVTRVLLAARRRPADESNMDGINYHLTLRMSESNCSKSETDRVESSQLYNGLCQVLVTNSTWFRTCQVVVNKQKRNDVSPRSFGSTFSISVLEQVCTEQRVCPDHCEDNVELVCGSDGVTYLSQCHLQQASCSLEGVDPVTLANVGPCRKTLAADSVLCVGCPFKGKENEEVREAANFAVQSLTSLYNTERHLVLESITDVKTQVVAGTNYFLTLMIGESDCPAEEEFNKHQCIINLDHQHNMQCHVVVYRPAQEDGPQLMLSQQNCKQVSVSEYVRQNCNRKCKRIVAPVCGSNGETFLNICLLEMYNCISGKSVKVVGEGECDLDPESSAQLGLVVGGEMANMFKNNKRWAVKEVMGATRTEEGVQISVGVEETNCLKTARTDAVCTGTGGPIRRCKVSVKNISEDELKISNNLCDTEVITICDGCSTESVDLAKWVVKKVSGQYENSREWALQNVQSFSETVVPGHFIRYEMSLDMSETTCKETRDVYSDKNCLIRLSDPDNFCEVTVLQSLKSTGKMISKRTCAGYNVTQFF